MTALTLVKDSETLGEDLTRQIVAAHIEEERDRLEKQINDMLVDGNSSYRDILALTSFSPDIGARVYERIDRVNVGHRVKQEMASHIVLRSLALEKELIGYIDGVEKIQRPEDMSVPRHLATATDNGLLEDVVNAGYAGIIAARELSDDSTGMKEAVKAANCFGIFESPELQGQAAQFAADYRKEHRVKSWRLSSDLSHLSDRLKRVLEYATCKKAVSDDCCSWQEHGADGRFIDSELLNALGRTVVTELGTLQHDEDATHSYLEMVKSLCASGKYPGYKEEHQTARDNARHFSDTITYIQVLHATLQKVPTRIKQEFYEFVAGTQREKKSDEDNEERRGWGRVEPKHPFADHFIMTLSIANHLYQWEGGVKEGSEQEKSAYGAVKSLHHLEAEKKLSDHGRMLPAQFYRAAMTLPVASIAAYGKMLEVGLTENEQFGVASMEPLQRLLQEQPVPIVETLYATAITTLRESNWHYAMSVLKNGTVATQKLVGVGRRGLKLLEGGTTNDA